MRRLVAIALALTLGNASVAVAGETLLTSASRIVQDLAHSQPPPMPRAVPRTLQAQEAQPGLASSGLRKRTKIAIVAAIAAGFAATALTIDRRVENTTPSTLGTRQDK